MDQGRSSMLHRLVLAALLISDEVCFHTLMLHRLVLAVLHASDEVCFHTLMLHRLVLAALQMSDEVCFHTCLVCAVVASEILLFQVHELDVASSAGAARADGVTVAAQPATATDVPDALTGGVCRHLQQEQHTVTMATD